MATNNLDGIFSCPAAADYTAVTKPRLVALNTSGQYALCGAGAVPDAVCENFPLAAGEQARGYLTPGIVVRCEVGSGGVTRGAKVCSDSAGKLVAGSSTNNYVGKALEAGADGEVISFIFNPNGLGVVA